MSRFILTVPPSSPIEIVGGGNHVSLYVLNYGPAGPSAYQLAVNNGFLGTEQEWLSSLMPRHYEHIQTEPLAVWEVSHSLGFRPKVQLLTLDGTEMWAAVQHTNNMQFIVYFDAPTSGMACYS